METTIKINTDALTPEFIEVIKKLFPHKTIEINISPADDIDFIIDNPAYAQILEDRIVEYEAKKKVISLKADDLL